MYNHQMSIAQSFTGVKRFVNPDKETNQLKTVNITNKNKIQFNLFFNQIRQMSLNLINEN